MPRYHTSTDEACNEGSSPLELESSMPPLPSKCPKTSASSQGQEETKSESESVYDMPRNEVANRPSTKRQFRIRRPTGLATNKADCLKVA